MPLTRSTEKVRAIEMSQDRISFMLRDVPIVIGLAIYLLYWGFLLRSTYYYPRPLPLNSSEKTQQLLEFLTAVLEEATARKVLQSDDVEPDKSIGINLFRQVVPNVVKLLLEMRYIPHDARGGFIFYSQPSQYTTELIIRQVFPRCIDATVGALLEGNIHHIKPMLHAVEMMFEADQRLYTSIDQSVEVGPLYDHSFHSVVSDATRFTQCHDDEILFRESVPCRHEKAP